jgi:hypothetical protein
MTCATILEVVVNGFVGFFTALFGAGAGAYAAYRFAVKQQEDAERKLQYRAAATAMFTLISRFSALENFRRKSMTEDRRGLIPERETSFILQYSPDTKLDFPSLSFLADPSDSEFLHELSLSESHFFNFVEALRERNDHLHEIMRSCEVHEFDEATGQSVISAKPTDMKLFADQNRNLLRAAVIALDSTHQHVMAFTKLLKRRFPGLPVFRPSILEEPKE